MLELADVVRNLRAELYTAMSAATGEELQFDVGGIELELSVAVSREAGASGRVRFWVLDLGAEGSVESNAVQKVTLALTPRVGSSGHSPLISSPALPDEGVGPVPAASE